MPPWSRFTSFWRRRAAPTVDTRYLFALEHRVSPDNQRRLIEWGRRAGTPSAGASSAGAAAFWHWSTLRLPSRERLAPGVRRWFEEHPDADYDNWAYFSRLDPTLPWEWVGGEGCALVAQILEPVLPLFRVLTRVKIVLQIPGKTVHTHRDLVPGTVYEDLRSEYDGAVGTERLLYKGLPWIEEVKPFENEDHHRNLCLSLKIPLSDRPGEPGRPFIVAGGRKAHYNPDDRLFFLNEVDMQHGADPVPFWRGVVFVNGLWNLDRLTRIPRLPVSEMP